MISIVGDESVGVYIKDSNTSDDTIDNTISGLYRQRGGVSVTGEKASAIIINGAIGKSFQLEAAVTARGVAHTQSDAGVEESELDLAAEKSQSGTAVKISANIDEGVLINGAVNRLVTDDERKALTAIREKRSNGTEADADDKDVSADKPSPIIMMKIAAQGQLFLMALRLRWKLQAVRPLSALPNICWIPPMMIMMKMTRWIFLTIAAHFYFLTHSSIAAALAR